MPEKYYKIAIQFACKHGACYNVVRHYTRRSAHLHHTMDCTAIMVSCRKTLYAPQCAFAPYHRLHSNHGIMIKWHNGGNYGKTIYYHARIQ